MYLDCVGEAGLHKGKGFILSSYRTRSLQGQILSPTCLDSTEPQHSQEHTLVLAAPLPPRATCIFLHR